MLSDFRLYIYLGQPVKLTRPLLFPYIKDAFQGDYALWCLKQFVKSKCFLFSSVLLVIQLEVNRINVFKANES